MCNYHSSSLVGRAVLCWEGEANHDHTSVAPRLASCFEAAIIRQHAPGGVPVPSLCLLLCPLLRDHRPHCLFSCLFVCFHHNSSNKGGPDLLKLETVMQRALRKEAGRWPATTLVPGDSWQIPSHKRPSVMHSQGCLQIVSTDWQHSFIRVFNYSFSRYRLPL